MSDSNNDDANKMRTQINELKKLQISKDSEISKLNDFLSSKTNEISELKKTIEEQKNGSREKELEKTIKEEKEKYLQKINNLEIKIYSLTQENTKIKSEIKNLEFKNNNLTSEILEKEKQIQEQKNTENHIEIKYNFDNKKLIINKIINYFINSAIIPIKTENISNDEGKELTVNHNLSEELADLREKFLQYKSNNNQINDTNINKIDELSQIIENYKSGNLIPDSVKTQIENLNKNHLSEIENLKKNYNSELILKDDLSKKNKELDKKNINLKLYIKNISIAKRELENVIFKQEQKISNLESKVNELEILLNTKNNEIKQNENNSLNLIKVINEQQTEINKLKTIQNQTKPQYKIMKPKTKNNSSIISLNDKFREIQNIQKSHNKFKDEIFQILSNRTSEDKLINQNKSKKKIPKTIQKKRQLIKIKLNYDDICCSSPNVVLPRFNFNSRIPSSSNGRINYRNDNNLINMQINERYLNLGEYSPDNKNSLKNPKLPFITYSTKNSNKMSRINILEDEENEKKEEISSIMKKIIEGM